MYSRLTCPFSGVARTNERVLRAAVAAYLGRYRGQTRAHAESDLRVFLRWCTDHDLDPLVAARADLELYLRWLQDVRRYQPSTVSRRLSVVVCFYRACVIDQILAHSPADYERRPTVPPESPTLGLGHLQFEALITTARLSANPNDFALIAMLGLLGLRIFEACAASINDLGEEHGHRVLRVCGKGGKVVLVPLPPAVARAIDRAVGDRTDGPILRNTLCLRMDRHAATRRLKHLAATAGIRMPRMHPHMLPPHLRDHHGRRRRQSARRADRRPPRRPAHHDALRPGPQEPRPPPELHPGRVHGLRNVTHARGYADERARRPPLFSYGRRGRQSVQEYSRQLDNDCGSMSSVGKRRNHCDLLHSGFEVHLFA
jgi:site-specific recombinase XerD